MTEPAERKVPPGEVANLSVAYLVPHDGAFELEWTPPFNVVQGSVLVGSAFTLTAKGAEETDLESPIPDKVMWTLPEVSLGSSIGASTSDSSPSSASK